ncbi:hypothetical protein BJX99DRAFT_161500 [Aspergillus californicus]
MASGMLLLKGVYIQAELISTSMLTVYNSRFFWLLLLMADCRCLILEVVHAIFYVPNWT